MTFPIRFECTSCGKCCRFPANVPHYVFVTQSEAAAIIQATGLSWDAATIRDPKGRLSLRTVPYGDEMACRFLVGDKCSVYHVRPKQCELYPFFPGIIRTADTWFLESARCEGIGRGELITAEEIMARLKRAGVRTVPPAELRT